MFVFIYVYHIYITLSTITEFMRALTELLVDFSVAINTCKFLRRTIIGATINSISDSQAALKALESCRTVTRIVGRLLQEYAG